MAGKPASFWREREPALQAFLAAGDMSRPAMTRWAKDHGTTYHALRTHIKDTTGLPPSEHIRPAIQSPASAERLEPDELWRLAEEQTTKDVARHQSERFLDVAVPDTRPIGVSFISDQHIRASGPIALKAMREDAELTRETAGLYAVLGGDGVDNHIKHRAAMVAGGTKTNDDWKRYDHYLTMFGADKILALVSGNHDDWTRDEAGVDMVSLLASRNRLHYCPDEAVLRLTLHLQPYVIKMRHQARFNSSLNLTHCVKRLWDMGEDDFDIGVVGHHHQPAIEPFDRHGVQVWAARPGSYQITSSYTRRYGYPSAHPTCPTFILFPDCREIVGFDDVWKAANYLTWLRSVWPRGYRRRP